jgi:effector-binding domain-containing protein
MKLIPESSIIPSSSFLFIDEAKIYNIYIELNKFVKIKEQDPKKPNRSVGMELILNSPPNDANFQEQSMLRLTEKAFEIDKRKNKKKKNKSPKKEDNEILKRNFNIFTR